jgi:hypothetical protein
MIIIREMLVLSDYIREVRTQSKIDPSKTISEGARLACPRCKTETDCPEHGLSTTCRCGLVMTPYGNGLDCVVYSKQESI